MSYLCTVKLIIIENYGNKETAIYLEAWNIY